MTMPVALVTGSSRGIGKGAALQLAKKGFDVVLAARTVEEGDGRDDGDFRAGRPIEGSIKQTAREVEALGVKALPLRLDLTDPDSVDTLVDRVVDQWGRLDVLVNNATLHTYSNTRIDKLTRENIETFTRATFTGPLMLDQRALRVMSAQGGGRIITVSSSAGAGDPDLPPGEGGWGVLYGMVKAAQIRTAGLIRVEYPDQNIYAFSLCPGWVKSPVIAGMPIFEDLDEGPGADVPGSVIAWLASAEEAKDYAFQFFRAPEFAAEHNIPIL
jgi:NAD(P)-dependent dehydrogenase (short-subunit alcohol dehydrogenase family)